MTLYALSPVWYFVNQRIHSETANIYMRFDDVIPFIEWFIIPYVIWYAFWPCVIFWLFLYRDREVFLRALIFLLGGIAVCQIIHTVFPNSVALWPESFPRSNLPTRLVAAIYSTDRPVNVMPSMHCYNAIAVTVSMWKAGDFKRRRLWLAATFMTAVAICLSTVFIKQHSVWDFVGAVAVAAGVYPIAYCVRWPFLCKKQCAEEKKMTQRKHRFGDRKDGYLLRGTNEMFRLLPYIMKGRNESAVYFTKDFNITKTEQFMRRHRKQGYPGLSYTHLYWAAAVRALALCPKANRFVAGRRIYARKYIRLAMTIKEALTSEAKEYQIMCDFDPRATLFEVAAAFDAKVAEVRKAEMAGNDTDDLLNTVMRLPRFAVRFAEKLVRFCDFHGWLPTSFTETIPFFSSVYLVNNGSLGLESVHHHLYELGTISMFVSIGRKEDRYELGPTGEMRHKKIMTVRLVVDERVCDGYNYAAGVAVLQDMIEHPEKLMEPLVGDLPGDDEIDRKKKRRKRREI